MSDYVTACSSLCTIAQLGLDFRKSFFKIYLLVFGCAGFSLQHMGFL